MMPYDTSFDVLRMHIPILDAISEAYWEWEKQMQDYKEGKGRDEAAKEMLLSAVLDKRVKEQEDDEGEYYEETKVTLH